MLFGINVPKRNYFISSPGGSRLVILFVLYPQHKAWTQQDRMLATIWEKFWKPVTTNIADSNLFSLPFFENISRKEGSEHIWIQLHLSYRQPQLPWLLPPGLTKSQQYKPYVAIVYFSSYLQCLSWLQHCSDVPCSDVEGFSGSKKGSQRCSFLSAFSATRHTPSWGKHFFFQSL